MKKRNAKKIAAGVLAAALVLQSSAMAALPAFAEDAADDTVQAAPTEEADPTEAGTEPTEAETDPTEAETDPTEAATEPTEAATEPTEAATEPTEAATEPTEAETEPTEAETDPTEAATEPDTDTITLTGGTVVPEKLEKGGAVVVKGTVTSAGSEILSVDVGIYDSEGNSVYIGTAVPNNKTYDLNRMDRYIIFDKLPTGNYTYKVTASNAAHTGMVLTEQAFTVVNKEELDDIFTITDGTIIPPQLQQGEPFIVKGTLSSTVSNISRVLVGIYDNNDKLVSGCDLQPDAGTFDLSSVDEELAFHKLEVGSYTFRVIVTNNSNASFLVVNQEFKVVAKQAEAVDNLTISDGTDVPATIEQGTEVTIRGTVTSGVSEITSLTVGVYDFYGNLLTGKTIAPKATSYDLSGLDSVVSFAGIPAGEYTYQVVASNAVYDNFILVNKKFTVTAAASAADDLSITGVTEIPEQLTKGKAVTVSGIVTSGASEITSLTAGVYNNEGKMLTGKTVEPKAKSYDLKNLDDDVAFNTLEAGSYSYTVTATNAVNTNFKLVDKKFTVATVSAEEDTLTITGGMTVPETIAVGQSLSITGTVTSASSRITALTAGVYDMDGNFVTGRTIAPNAKTYNLRNLDAYVQFNKLPAGKYIYAVIVSNASNNNKALVNKTFTVGNGTTTTTPSTEDKLSITGGTTIPDTIAVGKALTVTGTVSSVTSNITSLTAGVYDLNGKFITGRTINPNAKTYDLSKLDSYIEFNKLPAGKYVYAVIATNAAYSNSALVNKQFTVGNGGTTTPTDPTPTDPPAEDKLTISGGTTIPDTLAVGKALTITGTVTSASSNITSLTAGVYDANGKLVTGKTVTPNAKTYNLKSLDNDIEFNKLTAGVYTYKVTATNAANNGFTVYTKQFTVGSGTTTTPPATDDKLTITGGTVIPDTLAVGKALTVTGTVTSASSNITALTVGVYSTDGKFITGRTISPNAKTYDLKKLDAYVEFNKLPAGKYVYAVIASNKGNTNYALVNKQFTVGNGGNTTVTPSTDDKLTISGATTIPDTLAKGKALTVTGTVTSASSNITSLTVGVYDNSTTKFVTGRTVVPNAKTYDLKKLDNYVEFNKLPAGNYTFAVIATNAANSNYALVSKQFKVGDGGTSTPSTNDALTISGGTSVPDTLKQGSALSVKGVVTSASSNITALTVGVYSVSGSFITGRTISPNAKSYDLKKLDNYVEFNKLSAGNYVYAVIATNAGNTNYALVSKQFTVSGDGSGTASDPITISGGTTVPGTLSKGRGVVVRGTVSSASSNITSLTAGVYDASGKLVTGTTVNPAAKTYNLNKLDSQVRFDQLAAGTYYYKVTVTNGANSGYVVVNQSFTVR